MDLYNENIFKNFIFLCILYFLSIFLLKANTIGLDIVNVDENSKPSAFQNILPIFEYLNSIPIGIST